MPSINRTCEEFAENVMNQLKNEISLSLVVQETPRTCIFLGRYGFLNIYAEHVDIIIIALWSIKSQLYHAGMNKPLPLFYMAKTRRYHYYRLKERFFRPRICPIKKGHPKRDFGPTPDCVFSDLIKRRSHLGIVSKARIFRNQTFIRHSEASITRSRDHSFPKHGRANGIHFRVPVDVEATSSTNDKPYQAQLLCHSRSKTGRYSRAQRTHEQHRERAKPSQRLKYNTTSKQQVHIQCHD